MLNICNHISRLGEVFDIPGVETFRKSKQNKDTKIVVYLHVSQHGAFHSLLKFFIRQKTTDNEK